MRSVLAVTHSETSHIVAHQQVRPCSGAGVGSYLARIFNVGRVYKKAFNSLSLGYIKAIFNFVGAAAGYKKAFLSNK